MKDECIHRIMVKSVEETMRRLKEHGYDPVLVQYDPWYGQVIDFHAPYEERLDFLRPDILPPR